MENRPPFDPNGAQIQQAAFSNVPVSVGPKASMGARLKYTYMYTRALQDRPPWINLSKILWIILGGWALFLAYLLAGLLLMLTLILIPFGIQAIRFAIFAFNPIGKEPYVPLMDEHDDRFYKRVVADPYHPITIFANIVWLIFFGWILFLAHLFFGLLNLITIIGFSNAMQHFKLAFFALWPLGKKIRKVNPSAWPLPPNVVPLLPQTTQIPIQQVPVQPMLDGGGETISRPVSIYSRPATAVMAG